MDDSFAAELQQYLAEPTAERFVNLRAAVAESPGYAPYSSNLEGCWELFEEGRFEEAKSFLLSVLPNWILNPGIHKMLSFAWHKLGQEGTAQHEFALAMAMVNGILSTGDGTKAQPYLVLHTKDEYDLLEYLGKRSAGQALVEDGEARYDRQMCDDGTEIWFDVTVPLTHLQRRHSRDIIGPAFLGQGHGAANTFAETALERGVMKEGIRQRRVARRPFP